jgi:threonine/homoserine/homoserine lactone efflux protein
VPSLSTYALFIATCLVLLAIPGPAVLYVVSRSVDQGRRAGLASVAGICTGTIVHVTLATIGLSSLVLASKIAFDTVRTVADRLRGTPLIARIERWFGGTVLIGLGVTSAVFAPHRSS